VNRRAHRARAAGEDYGQHDDQSDVAAAPGSSDPRFDVALTPILLVIGLNFVFTRWVIPAMDTSFYRRPGMAASRSGPWAGIWSIVLAVACATLFAFLANRRRS